MAKAKPKAKSKPKNGAHMMPDGTMMKDSEMKMKMKKMKKKGGC